MHCTVLRPISGPDGPIPAGQVVDTSAWSPRNREVLIKRRWLQPEPTYGLTPPASMPEETEPDQKPGKKER